MQTNAAGQVVLKLKTPRRDGTTHLAMSPLEFMERHIDGQLCGVEFCERYVDCGSSSDSTKRNLTAAQLTLAPRRQTADCRGWLWTATVRSA